LVREEATENTEDTEREEGSPLRPEIAEGEGGIGFVSSFSV
jgi:hypothetical protein